MGAERRRAQGNADLIAPFCTQVSKRRALREEVGQIAQRSAAEHARTEVAGCATTWERVVAHRQRRQGGTPMNHSARTTVHRLRTQINVEDREGRHGCALAVGLVEVRGDACPKPWALMEGRRSITDAEAPWQGDGRRSANFTSENGREWRAIVRTVRATGLWRDEVRPPNKFQENGTTRGSAPEQSRSTRRGEMQNSDPRRGWATRWR